MEPLVKCSVLGSFLLPEGHLLASDLCSGYRRRGISALAVLREKIAGLPLLRGHTGRMPALKDQSVSSLLSTCLSPVTWRRRHVTPFGHAARARDNKQIALRKKRIIHIPQTWSTSFWVFARVYYYQRCRKFSLHRRAQLCITSGDFRVITPPSPPPPPPSTSPTLIARRKESQPGTVCKLDTATSAPASTPVLPIQKINNELLLPPPPPTPTPTRPPPPPFPSNPLPCQTANKSSRALSRASLIELFLTREY